jgi:hypothetical protein
LRKAKSKSERARSRARGKAERSPSVKAVRSEKPWRWVVDNRMRNYGDIDYERRIIRINHAMHKRDRELLIDTLFHEELHRLFPRLGEWAICAMTRMLLPTLSARYRAWLYARIRER